MAREIAVADIKFGDIDARSEILARDTSKRQLFLDSFFVPPSVPMQEVWSGDRFLVVGPKGSGKTAFLRFLENRLDHETEGASRFIVFRDDVSTQDRDKLAEMSKFRLYSNEGDQSGLDEDIPMDYLNAWEIFIHREIAEAISSKPDLCGVTPEIGKYIKLVRSFFTSFKTSGFRSLLMKFTKGRIKVGMLGQSLEAEAEFIDKHGNLDVSEFARYCRHALTGLHFNSQKKSPRINIFFDEVNINFVTGASFKRNASIIRDLVSACGVLNSFFSEHQIPIYIYTALRSEVVDSVEGSVRELQKWVDDKAVQINWILPSVDYAKQPLIGLIKQRITGNLKRLHRRGENIPDVNLHDYFETKIMGHPLAAFIIFDTWGRPRDLVRMLSIAASRVPREGRFSTDAFAATHIEYSRSCWEEKKDELNSKYSQTEVETMKRVLTGFKSVFSRVELDARVNFQCNNDPRANQFFHGRNVDVWLEDLFKVGVLGNILKTRQNKNRPAYLYLGHRNFNSNEIMCVHRSLWGELGLELEAERMMRAESGRKTDKNFRHVASSRRPPRGSG